jgi:hypothetical protein
MELNVVNEIAVLRRLAVGRLRQLFPELFREAKPASNRSWLIKRIAWRLQALAGDDLSEHARRCTAELACDADFHLNPPCSKTKPQPVSISTWIDHRLPFQAPF